MEAEINHLTSIDHEGRGSPQPPTPKLIGVVRGPALIEKTRVYGFIAAIVLTVYFAWYLGVWPGPLGQDGYSLIANINQGVPRYTGKDPAWLLYALATYGATQRVEALMLPLILFQGIILSRIIGWTYINHYKKTAIFLIVFVACTPHILNFSTSAYPDAIFSLAFVGLLFEVWLSSRQEKISALGLFYLFFLFPIACFFKGNGVIALLPVIYLAIHFKGALRWGILAIILFWTAAIQIGAKIYDLGGGHGAVKPLILFETINFMQSRPMNLWETRHMVTDRTKEIMYRYVTQEDIDRLYDRDYWDTFWHQNQDRVMLRNMTKTDERRLRADFLKYNVWRNIPAFASSRVNIFLASMLGQGGMVGPDDARHTLSNKPGSRLDATKSEYNPLNLTAYPKLLNQVYEFSYDWRFLLWTPMLGLFLIFICTKQSIRKHDRAAFIISAALLIQLMGIFIFSIAAEYRYILIIFYAPLILSPIIMSLNAANRTTPT
ncbi:hypothetical protein [Ottowia sp.]|uniref:hypothetical protein n=1 Tax=Ottowia sp. TaxID=1898956 RepID=UPI002BBFD660|nr:hypothetical protein [Ottowia sp.]HOB66125.1 hypothetical protein [Ottowia sp.]HPZ57158.1 hypothetical protein [Ottowia sp.]HQD47138.1 hypothetical protein [Ottowia sp.]